MILLFSAVFLLSLHFSPPGGAIIHFADAPLLFSSSATAKKPGHPPFSKRAKKPKKIRKTAAKETPAPPPAYNCSETFQDEYSIGYIQLGYACDGGAALCVSVYHIERNHCRNGELTRYYCDPKSVSLFSSEKIKCPTGCDSSGLFCAGQK